MTDRKGYLLTGLIIMTLLSAMISCSTHSDARQQLFGKLDVYFNSVFPASEPGGAILIAKGDSILFSKGYGISDIQTQQPITPQTLFNLGSISKTFVSNAILILQEEGKLTVEDSLIRYFPGFKNKEIARKVKIKHLLSHTSGLPDNRNTAADSVFFLTAKDAENWYPVTQTDSLLFEPGSRFAYSNPAYNGLALIVEQVSGMKWQKFIAERIFKRSGMVTSTITDGPHPQEGVAHGYSWINNRWTEDDYGEEPTFPAAGNGGVWSSVKELVLYERALTTASFLKRATIDWSRMPLAPDNWSDTTSANVGGSWFIGKTPDGLRMVGHTGSQGGFLCNYQIVPEKQTQVIILCNAPRDLAGMTSTVFAMLSKANWLDPH